MGRRRRVGSTRSVAFAVALAAWGGGEPSLASQPASSPMDPPPSPDRLTLHIVLSEGLDGFRVRQRSTHLGAVPGGARQVTMQIHAAAAAGSGLSLRLGEVHCEPVACEATWEAREWGLFRLRFVRPWPRGEPLRLRVRFSGRIPRLPTPPRIDLSGSDPSAWLRSLTALLRSGEASGRAGHGVLGRDEAITSLAWPHALPVRARPVRDVAFGDTGPSGLLDVSAVFELPDGVRPVATGSERRQEDGRWRVEARGVRGFAVLLSRRWVRRCGGLARLGNGGGARGSPPPRVCVWTVRLGEGAARLLLQTALSALSFFEDAFGAYPWDHLDVVEQRLLGGAGGMEHAGLVTVSPLPFGSGGSLGVWEAVGQPVLRFVTVHEVAHQWWFALVGSDARAEPVLDEALAQWSTLTYFRRREGEERYAVERDRMVLAGWWLHRLEGGRDAPAAQPLSAFEGMRAYAALVYGKAPMLFEALEGVLGQRGLVRALSRYARRFRFGEAHVADLRAALTEGLSASRAERVESAVRRWWFERHGDEDLGPPTPERLLAPWISALLQHRGRRTVPREEGAAPGLQRGVRRHRVLRDASGLPSTGGMLRRALEALGGL